MFCSDKVYEGKAGKCDVAMVLQCHLRSVGYCSNASCYYESQLQLRVSCKFCITSANLWLMS